MILGILFTLLSVLLLNKFEPSLVKWMWKHNGDGLFGWEE